MRGKNVIFHNLLESINDTLLRGIPLVTVTLPAGDYR